MALRLTKNRLTKNGKRRGRPPDYLKSNRLENPAGVTKKRVRSKKRSGAGAATLLIVQRLVALRGKRVRSKKEEAAIVAKYVSGNETPAAVKAMARKLRHLRDDRANRA
jgi:hypothetical protein